MYCLESKHKHILFNLVDLNYCQKILYTHIYIYYIFFFLTMYICNWPTLNKLIIIIIIIIIMIIIIVIIIIIIKFNLWVFYLSLSSCACFCNIYGSFLTSPKKLIFSHKRSWMRLKMSKQYFWRWWKARITSTVSKNVYGQDILLIGWKWKTKKHS